MRDRAPYKPGIDPLRYEWLPDDDHDVVTLREHFPGSDGWLFVVRDPAERRRYLIECYWPWDLRDPAYRRPSVEFIPNPAGVVDRLVMSDELNPYQYADFQHGRLICVKEHEAIDAPLTPHAVWAIRANCRHLNRRYSYYESPPTDAWRKEWISKKAERDEKEFIDTFQGPVDEWAHAAALAETPHVYNTSKEG